MTSLAFDPADPAVWLARGRHPDHAAAIAAAWRDYPDLHPSAPLKERMARTRARVVAMRPVHEAIRAETERARVAANFAFAERQVAKGEGGARYPAILHARNQHGLSWDAADSYADGYYAARTGWNPCPPQPGPDGACRRRAYDLGFRDGGGCPEDLFDTARRAFAAAMPISASPTAAIPTPRARPLPSSWPSPTDAPRPARWCSRLLILGSAGDDAAGVALRTELLRVPASQQACIIVADAPRGFLRPGSTGDDTHRPLGELLAHREFEDVLVTADGHDLDLVDAQATAIPICRTMERTRNSALQQRAQLRLWLARGLGDGETRAAGHIRWGKVARGLRGALGEFTARYTGPHRPRGHHIRVELPDGSLATGFATPLGQPLMPERIISNRRNLRPEMTAALREFAAAIPQP